MAALERRRAPERDRAASGLPAAAELVALPPAGRRGRDRRPRPAQRALPPPADALGGPPEREPAAAPSRPRGARRGCTTSRTARLAPRGVDHRRARGDRRRARGGGSARAARRAGRRGHRDAARRGAQRPARRRPACSPPRGSRSSSVGATSSRHAARGRPRAPEPIDRLARLPRAERSSAPAGRRAPARRSSPPSRPGRRRSRPARRSALARRLARLAGPGTRGPPPSSTPRPGWGTRTPTTRACSRSTPTPTRSGTRPRCSPASGRARGGRDTEAGALTSVPPRSSSARSISADLPAHGGRGAARRGTARASAAHAHAVRHGRRGSPTGTWR